MGETLTASIGSWQPAPVATNIQWYRNGLVIVGGTGATRTLVAADQGGTLSFRVGGQKAGYTSITVTSPSTGAVAIGVLVGPLPSMTGTLKVGQTLTAHLNGTWQPAPVGIEYRWTANAVAIPGATGATYRLTAAEAGKTIIIKVIGHKDGYADLGRQSPASVAVAK